MASRSTVNWSVNLYDENDNDLYSSIGSTEIISLAITTGYGENDLLKSPSGWGFDDVYLPSLDVADKVITTVWLKNYNKMTDYEDYTDFSEEIEGVKDYEGDLTNDFADLFSDNGIDVSGFNLIYAKVYVADELQDYGSIFQRATVIKEEGGGGGGEEPEPPSPEPSEGRSKFYTVYLPTDENMGVINSAIFLTGSGTANVLQYFSSYKKFFVDIEADGVKTLKASKYDFGVDAPYTDKSIVEYSCGTVEIAEDFQSLLDYSPFSRLTIYMPFIGFMDLDVAKVMGKTLELKYKVDVLSGRCLAEIWSTCVEPSICIASYSGTIASDEIFGSDGGKEYWGTYELMTSMQLGELNAYVMVSTKEVLESGVADYEGLPCKEVVKVGDVVGFVRYDSIWASGMTATEAEKKEIESLLKSGVLVD